MVRHVLFKHNAVCRYSKYERFFDDVDQMDSSSRFSKAKNTLGVPVDDIKNDNEIVIDRERLIKNDVENAYRGEDGRPILGENASDARLLPQTLEGRVLRDQIKIDSAISKAIQNNIMSLHIPNNVRRVAAQYFVELYEKKVHRPTSTTMEVDAHIASVFVQNYAAIFQSLSELKKRVGESFNPQKILDVGYGPATGIVALNELMGNQYRPALKEACILGHIDMQKRAKIILSRQLNEVPETAIHDDKNEQDEGAEDNINEEDDLVGEVMTKRININTKLRKDVPGSGAFDLIILTHQLLRHEERFPVQIDQNLDHYLKLLAPGGHLVLIERGNPMGFEIIARARQFMIRPENYPEEHGKIPRPWKRGDKIRGVRYRSIPIENEIHLSNQQPDQEEYEKFMETLNEKFGEVTEEDLEFEPELVSAIEASKHGNNSEEEDYFLKVLAPCPHHRKCPLQLGKPQYYELKEGSNLKHCNFQKTVFRPRFTIELKKGKILATPWQTPTDGIGIKGKASVGSGRANGKDYEILSYSYLIVERSLHDSKSIAKIRNERAKNKQRFEIGNLGTTWETWPRIIRQPTKRKGHVVIDLCAPSGSFEKWTVPRSFDKGIYHDARKAQKGDLWGLDAKTKIKGAGDLNVAKFEKLNKERIKKLKDAVKQKSREIAQIANELDAEKEHLDPESAVDAISRFHGNDFNLSNAKKEKKYRNRKLNVDEF